MKELLATVIENREIAKGIWAITLALPESVGKIRGGQFANLSVGDKSFPLKRPLGICAVNDDDVTLCYQLKGDGTHKISEKSPVTSFPCSFRSATDSIWAMPKISP